MSTREVIGDVRPLLQAFVDRMGPWAGHAKAEMEALDAHLLDMDTEIQSLRSEVAGTYAALGDAAEREDQIRDRFDRAAVVVRDQIERIHRDARHHGPPRFCREPECDGWDLTFRDVGWVW